MLFNNKSNFYSAQAKPNLVEELLLILTLNEEPCRAPSVKPVTINGFYLSYFSTLIFNKEL